MNEVWLGAVKASAATLIAGLAAVWGQVNFENLDGISNVGLVGVLAALIGRYTFRQLEDYRDDLKTARVRIDELQDDLHQLGKAKADDAKRLRDIEDYAHRLRLYLTAEGHSDGDLPPPPALEA